MPGFVDCHVHFPQLDIIASYGEQLLDWLERYAYPAEAKFADVAYAHEIANVFLDELLKNGTTTALVFGTVHAHSADAIFEAAEKRDMRIVAGKVLMDSNCPAELQDTPESAYADSKALIERWHGKGRLGYAITPRFAITSSEEQLAAAGRLAGEYPDVWIHTHLHAIQRYAEGQGCSVVRDYCGHGIGKVFHEDPQVLHYGRPGVGELLVPGMVFTIEPMINLGKKDTRLLADGWTVHTRDRSLSAQWEHTLAVTEDGYDVLTQLPGDEL